jgi:hypothetical protein
MPHAHADTCTTWDNGCYELRAAINHATSLLTTDNVTITFAPAIGTITLGSGLALPTLNDGASLTISGPAGAGAARPVIAVGASSGHGVSRLANSGAASRIEFQSLDFQEVRFAATGPGELRFSDASLKATAAGIRGFTLTGDTAGQPRLVLNRVVIDGFKITAGAGGAVNANPAIVVATGAAVWCSEIQPGMILGSYHAKEAAPGGVQCLAATQPVPAAAPLRLAALLASCVAITAMHGSRLAPFNALAGRPRPGSLRITCPPASSHYSHPLPCTQSGGP